ncbi:unnamed protein product [Malus baccata var. baccata]
MTGIKAKTDLDKISPRSRSPANWSWNSLANHRHDLGRVGPSSPPNILGGLSSSIPCDFDKEGNVENDTYTDKVFRHWRKGHKNFRNHEGGVGSLHNKALQQTRDLMSQKQHTKTFVIKQTDEPSINYHPLLSGSLDCTRWLLRQGIPFHGHDESLKSSNKAHYFLVDESRDVLTKEQMAMVLHDVNKKGDAIERFLGVQHVSSTTSSSLKETIETLFASTNLSMSKLQGQGYDGASNMKAKINEDVANFFNNASSLVNLIGSSCKCRDAFWEKQQAKIKKALDIGDLETVMVELLE